MIYIIYSASLLLLINVYFKLASRVNIVDQPNERSSHAKPVLRGGGIIFPVGAIFWFIWSGCQLYWFISGLLIISLISLVDDIHPISFKIRLSIHIVAIIFLLAQFELFHLPWWLLVIIIVTTTGIINAFNFMDGINGMTAGYSLSVLIGLWVANNYQINFIGNELIYFMMIALVVFGMYNFRKNARCFCGDVGSVSISFILVFLLGKLILTSGNIVYIMFMAIYGVDTFLTIITRLFHGENIFKPHRQHLYQILANEYQISQLSVSSGFAIIQLLTNLLLILLIPKVDELHIIILSIFILVLFGIGYLLIKKRNNSAS